MPAEQLEEGVHRFVAEVTHAYRDLMPPGEKSVAIARAVAERVREPWRQGGPAMHETRDLDAPTRHGAVRLRLRRPGAAAPRGVLVYLHGGGFTIFSIDSHDRVMRELAARSGFAVVGVDYALAPEARYPVALEQVVDATRWLAGPGAETFGLAGLPLAIGGDSAGGNLSFGTALTLRDSGEATILRGIVTAYGGFGIIASDAITARYGGEGYMLTREESLGFWANYLADPAQREDPLVCPIKADLRGLSPVMLAIPRCDINAEQNEMMAAALREAKVPVHAVVYEGATHSFLEAVSISDIASRALQDIADWLVDTVAAPAGTAG